jgi:NADH-quinone oxidoreductase subunit F
MPAEIGTKLVSAKFGVEDARTVAGYERLGGYQALRKALGMTPEAIVNEVKASNLRGRGGAGFATGVKWTFVPKDAKDVHVVVNCDESEPGTCKDRELIYWDPHLLIEGIAISAFALKAVHNYIYIRGEMMREYAVLARAVDEAYAKGYLGKNVLGSGFECHITVHRGAGARTSAARRRRSSTRSRVCAASRGSSRRSRRSRASSATRPSSTTSRP